MKKIIVLSLLAGTAILFNASCANKKANTKAPAAAGEVAELKKKYTPAQMEEGRVIYTNSCQKCHQLYKPTEFSIKKWDNILPEMCQKAELTAEQAGKVRAWVITNAAQS